ncbi:MAG: hypothetical protein PHY47_24665 [Lachnospiraceae bacterium]|nr:hypothetical protein [Lachnospiraceae bacterium]
MTYEVKWTGKFKKSFKLAKKRGLDLSLLKDIIEKIRTGVSLYQTSVNINKIARNQTEYPIEKMV